MFKAAAALPTCLSSEWNSMERFGAQLQPVPCVRSQATMLPRDAALRSTRGGQAAFRSTISAGTVNTTPTHARSSSLFPVACRLHAPTRRCSRRPCAPSSWPRSRSSGTGSSARRATGPQCRRHYRWRPIPDPATTLTCRRRILLRARWSTRRRSRSTAAICERAGSRQGRCGLQTPA
jgi:hypothetical protein